jgi:hypothetical protein
MFSMKKLLKRSKAIRANRDHKNETTALYKKVYNKISGWNLRKITQTMLMIAIPVAIFSSYMWYTRLYMTNERRVWTALNNSMATPSVTRTIKSGGSGNEVVQYQQFFFVPQMVAKSKVTYSQKSATIDTNVVTEGVSYPDRQYSRYVAFSTNQKKDDGNVPSLDSILGRWGKSTFAEEQQQAVKDNYIGEMITLAIFGNFDAQFRNDAISRLKNEDVYSIKPGTITKDVMDNRDVIIVPVTVKLKPYATLLQASFVKAGYGSFAPLDPENYTDDSTLPATLIIDLKNNSLYGVSYGDRQETYTAYGITEQVIEPSSDISSDDLEAIVREEISTAL